MTQIGRMGQQNPFVVAYGTFKGGGGGTWIHHITYSMAGIATKGKCRPTCPSCGGKKASLPHPWSVPTLPHPRHSAPVRTANPARLHTTTNILTTCGDGSRLVRNLCAASSGNWSRGDNSTSQSEPQLLTLGGHHP